MATPRSMPVATGPKEPVNRDSNAVRASVLDAALQLGLGTNAKVAHWLFNPLQEEEEVEEEESALSPGLTQASSEESFSPFLRTPQTSEHDGQTRPRLPLPAQYDAFRYDRKPDDDSPGPLLRFATTTSLPSSAPSPAPTPTPSGLSTASAKARNKLRKARPDGYESDGGYISDGPAKRDKAKSSKKKQPKEKDGDESDGGYFSDAFRGRKKKSKKDKVDTVSPPLPQTASPAAAVDNDTDGGYLSESRDKKKKKKKGTRKGDSPAQGDLSDGGYLSESAPKVKKSKSFFRRRKDEPSSPPSASPAPPPVPALPHPTAAVGAAANSPHPPAPPAAHLTLPIAERFARSAASTPIPTPPASRASDWTFVPDKRDVAVAARIEGASLDGSPTLESRDREDSYESLTSAFRDALSMRSAVQSSVSTGSWDPYPDMPAHSQRDSGHRYTPSPLTVLTPSPAQPRSASPSQLVTPPTPTTRKGLHIDTEQATFENWRFPRRGEATANPRNPSPLSGPLSSGDVVQPSSAYILPSPTAEAAAQRRVAPAAGGGGGGGGSHLRVDVDLAAQGGSPRHLSPAPGGRVGLPRSPSPHHAAAMRPTSPNQLMSPPSPMPMDGRASPIDRSQSPVMAAPRVLGLYDLPPPSPPPTGPLPRPPTSGDGDSPDASRAPSRNAAGPPSAFHPSPSRPGAGTPSPRTSIRRSQLYAQAIPDIQRGRESPFPARPILPKEDSDQLVRLARTASVERRERYRELALAGGARTPISAEEEDGRPKVHWEDAHARLQAAYGDRRTSSEDEYDPGFGSGLRGPHDDDDEIVIDVDGASDYGEELDPYRSQATRTSDAHMRRYKGGANPGVVVESAASAFDQLALAMSDRDRARSSVQPGSGSLAAQQIPRDDASLYARSFSVSASVSDDYRYADDTAGTEDYEDDDRSHYSHYPEDERHTMYSSRIPGRSHGNGADSFVDGSRLSTWSGDARASFFDEEKSDAARGRLLRGVEDIIQREHVPPVPRIDPALQAAAAAAQTTQAAGNRYRRPGTGMGVGERF